MTKLINAALVALVLSLFGPVTVPALAQGDPCVGNVASAACDTFLRQQNAAGTNPQPGGDPRCVYVVSNTTSALVLRDGIGISGAAVTSWRLANLQWSQVEFRGEQVLRTQICFSKQIPFEHQALTLCALDGHSEWRAQHLAFLKQHHVDVDDPVCVGGESWCGGLGL